jgi:hypothetical protein
LLDGEGYVAFADMEQHAPERLSRLFPTAGYLASRSGWNPGDDQLVFDCGGAGVPGGRPRSCRCLVLRAVVGRPRASG